MLDNGDPPGAGAAWGVKERVRMLLAESDPSKIRRRLADFYDAATDARLPEAQCMCKLLGATPRVGGFTPELRCVANADTCRFRLAALALNNQWPFARDLPTSLSTCDTLSRGMRPAFVRARMGAEHTTPAGVLDIRDYGPLRMIMRPSRHAPVTSEQLVGRPL
jgi:hypothetical protein